MSTPERMYLKEATVNPQQGGGIMDIRIRVTATHSNGKSMTATVAVDDEDLDWFRHVDGEIRWDQGEAYGIARDMFLDELDFRFEAVGDARE